MKKLLSLLLVFVLLFSFISCVKDKDEEDNNGGDTSENSDSGIKPNGNGGVDLPTVPI